MVKSGDRDTEENYHPVPAAENAKNIYELPSTEKII
jgi:hypothetical protein